MNIKFNTGDVVSLKSGGPLMTVSQTYDSDVIDLVYWDFSKNVFADATFESSLLMKPNAKIQFVRQNIS